MSVAETALSAPARSRLETRRRLIDAATELFASEGLHGTTSARIARRAGVATGTFYLHFGDKQALFREILLEAARELRTRLTGVGPADSREALRGRFEAMLAFAEERQALVRVLFGRDQAGGSAGGEFLDSIVPGVEERLAERVASGQIPAAVHPGVAARALAEMIARVVAWWVEDPTRATREEVVETLLHMHPIQSGANRIPDPGANRIPDPGANRIPEPGESRS